MVFADEKEKARVFESNFEPINLLIRHGWEIENSSSLLYDFLTTTLWVMKKKITEVSEIKEGMKLIRGDKIQYVYEGVLIRLVCPTFMLL